MKDKVVMILEFAINSNKDLVFEFRRKDKLLHEALKVYKNNLEKNNFEVFYFEDNILACEKCYFLAFFEDDPSVFLEEETEQNHAEKE